MLSGRVSVRQGECGSGVCASGSGLCQAAESSDFSRRVRYDKQRRGSSRRQKAFGTASMVMSTRGSVPHIELFGSRGTLCQLFRSMARKGFELPRMQPVCACRAAGAHAVSRARRRRLESCTPKSWAEENKSAENAGDWRKCQNT